MQPQAYSTLIFRERSGEARKNTTEKVPHYAQKLPRHMANNFTASLYANGISIMSVAWFARDRQYFSNTRSPHSFIKKYGSRVSTTLCRTQTASPWLAISRCFYAAVESWLATPNSAAHAHLAIGAYTLTVDTYRRMRL